MSFMSELWHQISCGHSGKYDVYKYFIENELYRLRWEGMTETEFPNVFTVCNGVYMGTLPNGKDLYGGECVKYHYDTNGILRVYEEPRDSVTFYHYYIPDRCALTEATIYDEKARKIRNISNIRYVFKTQTRSGDQYWGMKGDANDNYGLQRFGNSELITSMNKGEPTEYFTFSRILYSYSSDAEGQQVACQTYEDYVLSEEDIISKTLPKPTKKTCNVSVDTKLADKSSIDYWLNADNRYDYDKLNDSEIFQLEQKYMNKFWLLKEI